MALFCSLENSPSIGMCPGVCIGVPVLSISNEKPGQPLSCFFPISINNNYQNLNVLCVMVSSDSYYSPLKCEEPTCEKLHTGGGGNWSLKPRTQAVHR